MRDFIAAHTLTLESYAKAELALKGGTQYMSSPPRQLEFILKCRCTRGSSLDPASTFELVGSRWETIEEYTSTPLGAINWRRSAESRERIQREYGGDPRYVGTLPVQFVVEGFSLNSGSMLFPQHRSVAPFLQAPHVPGADVCKMLADALVLCVSSIRVGLSLKCAERQVGVSYAPLPGCFVRTNKRWIWEPLLANWEQYLKGPRGIQKVDSLVGDAAVHWQSEVPFEQLLTLFRVL